MIQKKENVAMKRKAALSKERQYDFLEYHALNNLVDIINLLLCLYVSLLLLKNPVFGAALYVSSLFLSSFFKLYQNRVQLHVSLRSKILWGVLFVIALALDFALIVLYPSLRNDTLSLLVCGFVIIILFRSIALGFVYQRFSKKPWCRILAQALEILFMVPVIFFAERYIHGFHNVLIYITYLLSGFIILLERSRGYGARLKIKQAEDLRGVASYKLYQGMMLCTYIAFYLALFMYISYMFCFENNTEINMFLVTMGWLALVCVTTYLTYRMIMRTSKAVNMGLFVAGALMWIFSSVMMFRTSNTIESAWWSILWAVGVAIMYAVLTRMDKNFKLYSVLLNRDISEVALRQNTLVIQNFALLISGIMLIVILTGWSFVLPYANGDKARYLSSGITLLPMVFMLMGVYFALLQPMDEHNKERLEKLSSGSGTEEMRARLNNILIAKYRKRLGVRLIMIVLRPFLRHRVIGRENVKAENFPAIFVCNHGEIYGPVAAVIYLPYYFRPWIDERMLNPDKNEQHIYQGTFARKRWMPEKMKRWLTRLLAALGRWAFGAFDPIPVYRDELRSIFKTFNLSVAAMQAEENILLFPENPQKTQDGRYESGDVGSFFTGFAHIGKAYYIKTGKCTTFYPIYSDKKKRIFQIGSGIKYNPEHTQAEEKRRIAEELNRAMKEMAENPPPEKVRRNRKRRTKTDS